MPIQKGRTPDRRIARTQKLLRDALHSLIHERDYDSIAIKEILDRANVGRSAFYMHFRDKDDLLAATFHEIFGSVPSIRPATGAEKILWFSLPIFEHLDRLRRAGELSLGPRGRAILHGHLQKALVGLIAEQVGKSLQGRRKSGCQIPLDLVVQCVASTFILVLNWWVDSRSKLSPKQVDDLFRALIQPTLASTSE
jgi:AcrR family transcriptional regulator